MNMYTIAAILGIWMLGDVVTGIGASLSKGERLDSTKLREGMWHKAGFVALLLFTGGIDYAAPFFGVKIGQLLYPIAAGFIFATETVSIFENISVMNPDIRNSKIGELLNWNDKKE